MKIDCIRKPRRHCRGIMPQFVDKILSGEKTTTIRPYAKNMQIGDLITFWVGWRKKNPTYICTAEIIETPETIVISDDTILISSYIMWRTYKNDLYYMDRFAKSDGFTSFADMITFFQSEYPPKKNKQWVFGGKLITFGNIYIEERFNKNRLCK